MPRHVPALIMLPPAGNSPAEKWMAAGRRAAALDLVDVLQHVEGISSIHILVAEADDQQAFADTGATVYPPWKDTFHFGSVLASFIERLRARQLVYLGGASAPLLDAETVSHAVSMVSHARKPCAIANNVHSTDWILFNHARTIVGLADRLPTDNPLGWVLRQEAGYEVESLPATAASRADIDTPSDLLLLSGHPRLGSKLQTFLGQAPQEMTGRVECVRRVLTTPASSLSVIGRSTSGVWAEFERHARIWVRFFVEERGMVASGRLARGEVRSLVGRLLDALGVQAFVDYLASISDAVLWDTRVWMAHRGAWPSTADRYAADLGWADQVSDPELMQLTRAIQEAPIPILAGGHGVVAGSIYALLETLRPG